MSFPRYERYRDSGLEWLGDVPAHWSLMPLKRDVAFLTSGSRGWADHYADDGALFIRIGNLTREHIDLDLTDIQRVAVPDGSEGERTRVAPGDVLFSITAYLGSVAVVPESLETAYVSQHVALTRMRGEHLLPAWVGYVALSMIGKTYLAMRGYGGTKVQLSLDDIAELVMTVPPLVEQEAINAFLDRETGKIDALVEEQRRLIELLKEKRQAVISHAVTKGLDPTAPMKDSGMEWLGEVPAHWSIGPMKRISTALPGLAFSSAGFSTNDEHVRLLRGVNVGVGTIKWDETVYWERQDGDGLDAFDLHAGDVVLGMDRPWIGDGLRVAKIGSKDVPTLLLQRVAAVRPRAGQRGDYLFLALSLPAFFHHCAPEMTGISVPHISGSQIEDYVVAVPPEKEQRAIVIFVEERLSEFDGLGTEAEAAIALLQERRAALISAAVTGKIDVRGLSIAEAAAA